MALVDEFERQGNWFFRRRGYLPLLMVPLLLAAMVFSNRVAFLDRDPQEEYWLLVCLGVSLLGLLVRVLVIGFVPSATSGRNTREQRASILNTTGMYSVVRHPLYLGNFLIALGIALDTKVFWFVLLFATIYWIYYERIMYAEESFLRHKFGEEFNRWAAATPAFLPRFRQFRAPDLTFSLRMVLRREYPGLLLIAVGFAALEWFEERFLEHEAGHALIWYLLSMSIFLSVVLRVLKKQTSVLAVTGR